MMDRSTDNLQAGDGGYARRTRKGPRRNFEILTGAGEIDGDMALSPGHPRGGVQVTVKRASPRDRAPLEGLPARERARAQADIPRPPLRARLVLTEPARRGLALPGSLEAYLVPIPRAERRHMMYAYYRRLTNACEENMKSTSWLTAAWLRAILVMPVGRHSQRAAKGRTYNKGKLHA
jgi:hypothetical protein